MWTIDSQPLINAGTMRKNGIDPSAIEKLPSEIKERLASFLDIRDLLRLAQTSRSVSSDLNLSVASSPLTDRASQNKSFRCHEPQCFAVIIPNQESTPHSLIFACKVQIHGHLGKSELQIVEQNLPVSHQDPDLLQKLTRHNGKKIARKAKQSATRKKPNILRSFPVKPNKFYQLYINTRGHKDTDFVQFSDMSLHRIGFNERSTEEYVAYQFDVFEQTRPIRHIRASVVR